MKTTLIYPGIAGYGFESVGKGMEAGWISHGLAHLSAAIKSQGFEVDLIDLRALRGWEHFRSEIEARQPDVVGVTMMGKSWEDASRTRERSMAFTNREGPSPGRRAPASRTDSSTAARFGTLSRKRI